MPLRPVGYPIPMLLLLVACGEPPVDLQSATVAPGCAALAERVEPARVYAAVEHLASAGRRTPAEREAVRTWLATQLARPSEARPFTLSGVSGVNLVVPGSTRVLVGAHYDAVEGTPGADDNASGVAVVLEVARVLGAGPTYAFFDAEEPFSGIVGRDDRNFAFGSQAFVDADDAYDLAIVLESVGYGCDGCQQLPPGVPSGAAPRDGRAIYVVGNTDSASAHAAALAAFRASLRGRAAIPFTVPGRGTLLPQSRFSDHAAFWDAGIPALLVTDTALLRNPQYHEAGDLPEKLDRELLAGVARGAVVAVAQAAKLCGGG